MRSEWQQRLDLALVILIVFVAALLIWRLLGPHFFAMGTALVNLITGLTGTIQGLTRR